VGNWNLQSKNIYWQFFVLKKQPSVNSVDSQDVKYSYPLSMLCNTGESSEVILV